MELVETPVFTRQVGDQMDAEEYRGFQLALLTNPELGRIVPKSGGLRKIRWRASGRGKRGGIRVIYYWMSAKSRIYLLFLYPKNVLSDVTEKQLRTLRLMISDDSDGEG